MSSRQWYSISNIMGGQALQTFREKNLGVWFDLPDASFLDVQVRKLANVLAICKRIDNKEVTQYLYNLKIDRKEGGKIYYPHFRFMYNGKRYYFPYLKRQRSQFKMIPSKLLKEINKKVSEFKEKILEKNQKEAEILDNERFGDYKEKTAMDYAQEIMKNPDKFILNEKINKDLIRYHYNIPFRMADTVVALLKKEIQTHNVVSIIQETAKKQPKLPKERKDLTKYMKSKGGLKQDK